MGSRRARARPRPGDGVAPDDVRDFIGSLLRAVPDLRFEIVSTTTEGDRCAVQWRMRGAFAGDHDMRGVEPNGAPILLEGVDLVTVRDGLIQSNDAFSDGLTFAEQVGLLPARGSSMERGMLGAFNAKTRLEHRLAGVGAEPVADGVWFVQGQPARCNVYLLADGGGVTLFDAGARTMVRAVASAAAPLGGVRRIVLGHGHTDHRGVANAFDVPILCHPDEVLDAEGSGGFRYWGEKLPGLPPAMRPLHRMLHRYFWDGGPVRIAGTVERGRRDRRLPRGAPPGPRARPDRLWRESDRLALVSDASTRSTCGVETSSRDYRSTPTTTTPSRRGQPAQAGRFGARGGLAGPREPVTGDVRASSCARPTPADRRVAASARRGAATDRRR